MRFSIRSLCSVDHFDSEIDIDNFLVILNFKINRKFADVMGKGKIVFEIESNSFLTISVSDVARNFASMMSIERLDIWGRY